MNDRLARWTTGQGAGKPNAAPGAGPPTPGANPPSGSTPLGQVFLGKYQVISPLGEGAMGKVYLARRRGDGSKVVVKVMHTDRANQPKFRELFEREMGFMTRFQHPNVVALYDASCEGSQGPCIVMEYVPGSDLEQLLQKHRRFPAVRVGRLLGQLCSALQAAHSVGIIHRDLKPANLMVLDADTDREQLKVMDFGLAKLSAAPHLRLEQLRGDDRDVATGTPEYMASEQARGDEVDHRADLYSVGVILYELLTGRLPFDRPSVADLLSAHIEDPPPPFKAVGAAGAVPPGVESVVLWCLSKYPNERPQSAWELAERFEHALGQKVLQEIAPPVPVRAESAAAVSLKPTDASATTYELEAWMPERIAVIKVRGFVHDAGGEVVESVPGLIRVSLGGSGCKYQAGPAPAPAKRGWFRSAPPPPASRIDMELHMQKRDADSQSLLHIRLVLRPAAGSSIRKSSPDWKDCCDRIFNDLRAYLICK
jgi:serine/threonine-protein kinase